MVNLLPFEDKKSIKREYLRRLTVIAEIFLLFITIIALIFLTTLYFVVNNQKKIYEKQFLFAQKSTAPSDEKEISSFVSELNKKVAEFEIYQKEMKEINEIIKKILEIKKDEIKINAFVFDTDSGENLNKITLRGVSQTRKGLIVFIESLKKQPDFMEVSSPLSSFLKSENVDFNISVKIHD